MTRIEPREDLSGRPCSVVGMWTAYCETDFIKNDVTKREFCSLMADFERSVAGNDGYCSLKDCNRQVRKLFNVEKYEYYKRNERMTLREYAETTKAKSLVCVLGHFLFADFLAGKYWSFFDNLDDKVVAVWRLK